MNKFFICFVSMFSFVCACNTQAQDGTTFKAVSPIDIFEGVGCYLFDTGERVVNGVGEIVGAPFKAKLYIPRVRLYRYEPLRLRLPRIIPLPDRDSVPARQPYNKPAREKMYQPLFKSNLSNINMIAFRF